MLKKKFKTLWLLVSLVLAFVFALSACGGNTETGGGGGGGGGKDLVDGDPYVITLEIVTEPVKTTYMPGQIFDPAGMTLVAKWSHGVDEELSPADCIMTPKGELAIGTTSLTFTYEGVSCTQKITVKDIKATGITVDSSMINKTQLLGTLDLTEIIVNVHYDDDSVEPADVYELSENGVEITDPVAYTVKKGAHTIKVKYGEFTDEFSFTALDGYIVDTKTVIETPTVEANRTEYLGKNFVEKVPGSSFYYGDEQDFGCLKQVRGGDIMRFHIYSEFDTNVELILTAASCYHTGGEWNNPTKMEDMQFNKLFVTNRVAVDPETGIPVTDGGEEVKTPLNVTDDVILPGKESPTGDMMLWVNFVDVSFGEIMLNKGDNIIEIKVVNAYKNRYGEWCAANISGFKVITVYNEEHEHELVKTEGTAPTCVKPGIADYWTCSVCSRTFSDAEGKNRVFNTPKRMPATGVHSPDGEATCTHASTCTVCNQVIEGKKAHQFEGGDPCLHDQKCTVCQLTIPAGHVLSWNNGVQTCSQCHKEFAYKIQAEDASKIRYANKDGGAFTPSTEGTTGTAQGWTNQIASGAESVAVKGLDEPQWKGATLEITVSVDAAGTYDFIMRGQANTSDGGASNQPLADIFSYAVNPEGEAAFAPVSGTMLACTPVGQWLQTYNWNTAVLARITLKAGENKVLLKFAEDAERGPNIDYFVFEKADGLKKADAEILVTREGGSSFAVGDGVKYDKALPGVHMRILVPEDQRGKVGAVYEDICLTAAMCEQFGFDTSTAGAKSMTVTVEKYGKTYTATFNYTVI